MLVTLRSESVNLVAHLPTLEHTQIGNKIVRGKWCTAQWYVMPSMTLHSETEEAASYIFS